MENDKKVLTVEEIHKLISDKYAPVVVWDEKDNSVMTIRSDYLIEIMRFLKENSYGFLADITSVDYKDRFSVIYQLYQFQGSGHLTVRVEIGHENPEIDSLCCLWDAANWLEREVWDLMGIRFTDHHDLRRILLWEGYEGHPLRKDYVHKPSKYQGRRSIRK